VSKGDFDAQCGEFFFPILHLLIEQLEKLKEKLTDHRLRQSICQFFPLPSSAGTSALTR
jgi:hypothetical protein